MMLNNETNAEGALMYNPNEQRKTKPKIDDILPIYLDGDALKNATDFVAFLRENKMSPGWRSPNSWCCSYKGKVVTYIKLGHAAYVNSEYDSWQIVFFDRYNDVGFLDENTKKIAQSKIRFCERCTNFSCAPGIKATIFNTEWEDNICCYMSLRFNNPDTDELNCAKKLSLAHKTHIAAK